MWVKYVIVTLLFLGIAGTINMVGKPRKPLTSIDAIINVTVSMLFIYWLLMR